MGAVADAVDGVVSLVTPGLAPRARLVSLVGGGAAAVGLLASRALADARVPRRFRNRFLTAPGSSRGRGSTASRQRSRSSTRCRLDPHARPPGLREVVDRPVMTDREPGHERGAARRRLAHRRDLDRLLRRVGQRLHERVVVGHAAVDAQRRDRDAAVGLGRLDEVGAALRDSFEHRAHDLRRARCRASGRRARPRAVVPRRACRGRAARARTRRRRCRRTPPRPRRTRRSVAIRPRSSRSHCTLVPAASITASMPHVTRPSWRQATIGNVPARAALVERRRASSPSTRSSMPPVPNVILASPAARSPDRRATPAGRRAAPRSAARPGSAVASPTTPLESTIVGIIVGRDAEHVEHVRRPTPTGCSRDLQAGDRGVASRR